MITVNKAEQIIHSHHWNPDSITVPLKDSLNCYLAEPVMADRDFPPFHRVTMDGIAIKYQDYANGQTDFEIHGIQMAGQSPLHLNKNGCLEVMTGAVCPEGADTIIPYEELELDEKASKAALKTSNVKKGQNIHKKGSDRLEGTTLISPGKLISPSEIAILATVGKVTVRIYAAPKILIVSTGNELVDVHEMPEPQQIRKSNSYAIQSILRHNHINSDALHLTDDPDLMKVKISEVLKHYDVLLFSGGVSKGKADFVPAVLSACGINKHFHRVKQRPGKPLWFGTGVNQKIVFAFPGNPVSTVVGIYRYFLPWFHASFTGKLRTPASVILQKDFIFKPDLTFFLQLKISYSSNGTIEAIPNQGQGSGDFANLLMVDGFGELAADKSDFPAGTAIPFYPIRPI